MLKTGATVLFMRERWGDREPRQRRDTFRAGRCVPLQGRAWDFEEVLKNLIEGGAISAEKRTTPAADGRGGGMEREGRRR